MSLRIAKNLDLPNEAITQTFAILAKRGVGKTYTASVMVEEMLKNNLPVVVLDPIGVWWGLRSSADGKKAGLPIIIAGGDHADVPITPDNGEIIANLVVDDKVSLVIDLSLFRKGEQTRFVTDFAETLYHNNRSALHIVADEADAFAPQRPMKGQERMLGAVEDLVRRGRARGIGVTLITQRPAVLNKDVLTQVEVLVTLRLIAPQDRNAINEWVKVHGEPGQAEELMQSLPSLPIGTAWFWSPGWLDLFRRVAVRQRETLDSSSTPKVGDKVVARAMADVDLDKLREQLSETIAKVESEDPRLLKKRIRELELQLSQQKPQEPKIEIKEVEVPMLDPEDVSALRELAQNLTITANDLMAKLHVASNLHKVSSVAKFSPPPKQAPPPPEMNGFKADKVIVDEYAGEEKLSLAERKILSALAQYPQGRSMTQTALLTGYAVNGGGFRNALSSLRTKGLIDGRGEIKITETGLSIIGSDYEPLPEGRALVEYWKSRLGKAERMILDVAVNNYPAELHIDQVAEMTGYAANGGGFRNALSRLRTLELIEGRSEIRAHETLVGA
jgi:hypothetical protein